MMNFDFLEKGVGIVSPLHFVYIFCECILCMFNFLFLNGGLLIILIDCLIFLSPHLDGTKLLYSYTFDFFAYKILSFDLKSKWL